jgi:hypothetical protein
MYKYVHVEIAQEDFGKRDNQRAYAGDTGSE